MTNNALPALSSADYKARLLLDGQAYRIGILYAKTNISNSLHTHALLHGAIKQAMGYAGSHLQSRLAPGGNSMQGMLPLVIAAFSFLSRKKLLLPALGVTLAAGVAAVVIHKRHTPY